MATTNYNLPMITGNMAADVVRDMNELAEATDAAIKEAVESVDLSAVSQQIESVDQRVTAHLDINNPDAHKAKNIVLEDVAGLFSAGNIEDGMKELFTSVSNGKQLIGTAITDVDKTSIVPSNPTFNQLANLIRSITAGKKFASGSGPAGSQGLVVTGLAFKPGIIVAKRQGYDNQFNVSSAVHINIPNFKISTVGDIYGNVNGNSANVTVTNNGFTVKGIDQGGWTYNWLAIE